MQAGRWDPNLESGRFWLGKNFERNSINMPNPEQPPDLPDGPVKPKSRVLMITLIVILSVVVVLAVGMYIAWIEIANQSREWWDGIKGSQTPSRLDYSDHGGSTSRPVMVDPSGP